MTPTLDKTFAALADPVRRGMLERLSRGPATPGELASPLPISKPAVSKHLRVLERAGLLGRHRAGKHHVLELKTTPLEAAEAWIETYRHFWESNLDNLINYLEGGIAKPSSTTKPDIPTP